MPNTANRILHLDLETVSSADTNVRKVGASRHARDSSTIVTVFAWAFGSGPVQSILLPGRFLSDLPHDVAMHLLRGGRFAAWNAAFEWAFLTSYFHVAMKPEQAVCTMQRALNAGLPAALEDAGDALSLAIRKDKPGKRLMLQMSKPKPDGSYWHDDPFRLAGLDDYCKRDVEAEREVHKYVPDLHPFEQSVSLLDRETNNRGIQIDLDLVEDLIAVAVMETASLNTQCTVLTGRAVTSPGTQTAKLTQWFASRGYPITDIGRETIADTLLTAVDAEMPPDVIEVLNIRQKVAKSSVGKLQAMLNCVDTDGRVRGTLQYYGASRTGRFSGRLIQPQNFPRPPEHYDPADAIRHVMNDEDNDFLRMFYDEPLSVVSACLRGCLIPAPGEKFLIFDLAQIEARVIAWLAGQQDLLDAVRRGEDIYLFTADQNGFTGNRTAGKVMVLGLGFGMGHVAFVEFAKGYGMTLSTVEANEMVTRWRDANRMIRKFWWDLDAAVKNTVKAGRHGRVARMDHGIRIGLGMDKANQDVLMIELPSGRVLWYRNPHIVVDPVQPQHDAIEFDGIHQKTGKWGPIRTWGSKLAENITQAVARDVICEAAIRVSNLFPGTHLVLSVHDELVFEIAGGVHPGVIADIRAEIEQPPKWARDLPVGAKGGLAERYGKG
jgi:DNA polymerase